MPDAAAIRITDDLGDELVLESYPERIVSLVPSITETVIRLGADTKVVGITSFCIHPERAVADIPRVGGPKDVSTEKIDMLRPDLIIANKEENQKHQINALRERYPVFVTYPRTLEGAVKTILDLGALVDRSSTASEMAATCDAIITSTHSVLRTRPLRTVCMIWRDPWMVVGTDTYVNDLLETFGFMNAFSAGDDRYPQTTLEAVLSQGPDVIVLPSEPYDFTEADHEEIQSALESEGLHTAILRVEGSYLTWFGFRTIQGLRWLRDTKIELSSKS
jgi:ABC-type Fe3+-hydroxamate transport system substrate-binding protein